MATETEQMILNELATLRGMMERLLIPVAQQAGIQSARMSREEIRANNKEIRERVKKKMREGASK